MNLLKTLVLYSKVCFITVFFFLYFVVSFTNQIGLKGRGNIENKQERPFEETSIFLNITSKTVEAKGGQSDIFLGTIDHSIGPFVTIT